MRISHALVMAGAAFLSATCDAPAAGVPSVSAFTVKGGVSVESNAKPLTGLAAGIDYIFRPSSTLQPFDLSFYGDLLGRSGGAGVAIRNAGPAYIGAGLGLYSVSVTTSGGCAAALPGSACGNQTFTSSGFGGKLFGGFNVAPFTALELGYHFLPYANGIQTNTVTAQLAVRF
jgi:hypothetical protein